MVLTTLMSQGGRGNPFLTCIFRVRVQHNNWKIDSHPSTPLVSNIFTAFLLKLWKAKYYPKKCPGDNLGQVWGLKPWIPGCLFGGCAGGPCLWHGSTRDQGSELSQLNSPLCRSRWARRSGDPKRDISTHLSYSLVGWGLAFLRRSIWRATLDIQHNWMGGNQRNTVISYKGHQPTWPIFPFKSEV